jgi:hypothetical protein
MKSNMSLQNIKKKKIRTIIKFCQNNLKVNRFIKKYHIILNNLKSKKYYKINLILKKKN